MVQEPIKAGSVFDFVYIDFQRVSLLISQFNDFGELSSVSESKSAGRGSEKSDSYEVAGSISVASGKSNFENSTNSHFDKAISRTYDPKWINAVNFLDEAEARGFINRDIASARMGEVVMISGAIKITDYGALREIWKKPSMVKAMKAGATPLQSGNRQERRKNAHKGPETATTQEGLEIFLDIIDVLPHTVQCTMGENPKGWGLLRPEGLVGSATDFALKFGGNIPGDWSMIGILEALPDTTFLPPGIIQTHELEEIGPAFFAHLEPITRQLLGRPKIAFGLTPLIILREVIAQAKP